MAHHLATEQNALRFALGLPAEPALIDIKPVSMLTDAERRKFGERLAAVTAENERLEAMFGNAGLSVLRFGHAT